MNDFARGDSKDKRDCVEVVKSFENHWESTHFLLASHVQVLTVQIVDNCIYSFGHVPKHVQFAWTHETFDSVVNNKLNCSENWDFAKR